MMMKNWISLPGVFLALLWPAAPVAAEPGRAVPLTLEQAYDRTLATDESVKIAAVSLQRAKLEPQLAWTKYGPQVNGNAAVHDRNQPSGGTAAGTASKQSGGTGWQTAGISLEQPLLDMSFFPAHRRGLASVETSRLEYRARIREILFGVAEAYYSVLSQQQVVGVDSEALRLAGEQLSLAQKRERVGEVTRSDTLRAQVAQESARRTLIEDSNILAARKNLLGNILNLAPDTEVQLATPADEAGEVPDFALALGRALAHREDLRAKTLVIRQDEERRNEVKAGYAPKVVAQFDGSTTDQSSASGRFENSWSASLAVRIPFFDGGQREVNLKDAGYQIEQSRLERVKFEKTVEQEVKEAWLNVKSLRETLPALRVQVAAAEQGYTDLQNQYASGTATSVDVLSALKELNAARKDLAVETYSLQTALRKLQQTTGGFQDGRVNQIRMP